MIAFKEALEEHKKRKVVLPDAYYNELQGLARALSFSIKGLAQISSLIMIKESIDDAIEANMSFDDWKSGVMDGSIDIRLTNNRLDNIFKTNIQVAYSRGRCRKITETISKFPYLLYDSKNDDRVRPWHLKYDGFVAHYTDPIWQSITPPNGFRCRCKIRPVSEKEYRIRKAIYAKRNPEGVTVEVDDGWDYNPCKDIFDPLISSAEKSKKRAGGFFKKVFESFSSKIDSLKSLFQKE